MAQVTEQQIGEFRRQYNALLNTSHHQYSTPRVMSVEDDFDRMEIAVEPGIDITVMREYFHRLVADAELGRRNRRIHEHNPAVQEAYHQYIMLLELTRRSHE